jgi:hypothetical protein
MTAGGHVDALERLAERGSPRGADQVLRNAAGAASGALAPAVPPKRHGALLKVALVVLVGAVVGGLLVIATRAGDDLEPAGPPVTDPAELPVEPAELGRPAVWDIDPSDPPTANSTSFTALVQRVECSGGVTGTVWASEVAEEGDRIVITFTVEPSPEGANGNCPGNDRVPYEVHLDEPLGERTLVDGGCETIASALCANDGVRWSMTRGEAIWLIDPASPPREDGTSFTALVQRVECSGGVTGTVWAPEVVEGPDRVVITFAVDPLPGGFYTCPGNDVVPYEVELSSPLGDRQLIDGRCATVRINSCPVDGVRWPDPADADRPPA